MVRACDRINREVSTQRGGIEQRAVTLRLRAPQREHAEYDVHHQQHELQCEPAVGEHAARQDREQHQCRGEQCGIDRIAEPLHRQGIRPTGAAQRERTAQREDRAAEQCHEDVEMLDLGIELDHWVSPAFHLRAASG
jgi:hypothetical protein